MSAPAFPPPGQRAPTTLPREMSEAVRMGREIFERAWVYAVSIDSPDELTLDDAGRKVADLVRNLLRAQMEADCALICPACANKGKDDSGLVIWPAMESDVLVWAHRLSYSGERVETYVECLAVDNREAFRKGIWADGAR